MKKRQFELGSLLVFLFLALATAVYAQQDPFEFMFSGIERIAGLYGTYYYAIDCILYAVILIGAAQFALSQQFQGSGGRAVIIGMGIALSLGAAFFERQTGFKLVSGLGPIAVIVVLILFCFLFYRLFTALGANSRLVMMGMFSLAIFYVNAQFPIIGDWMTSRGGSLAFVWSILYAFAIIFMFWVIIETVVRLVQASGVGGGVQGLVNDIRNRIPPPPPPPPAVPPTPTPPPPPAPAVPQPTNPNAVAADRDVIITWGPPASGPPPVNYIVRRYTRGRLGGSNFDRTFNGGAGYVTLPDTARLFVDNPPNPVNYRYSIQAVQPAAASPPTFTPFVRTNDPRCIYGLGVLTATPAGVRVELIFTSPGRATAALGGNLRVYGVDPAFTTLFPHNVPMVNVPAVAPVWRLFPAPPNPSTTIIGWVEIPAAEWAAMAGTPLIVDTQGVNI